MLCAARRRRAAVAAVLVQLILRICMNVCACVCISTSVNAAVKGLALYCKPHVNTCECSVRRRRQATIAAVLVQLILCKCVFHSTCVFECVRGESKEVKRAPLTRIVDAEQTVGEFVTSLTRLGRGDVGVAAVLTRVILRAQ